MRDQLNSYKNDPSEKDYYDKPLVLYLSFFAASLFIYLVLVFTLGRLTPMPSLITHGTSIIVALVSAWLLSKTLLGRKVSEFLGGVLSHLP